MSLDIARYFESTPTGEQAKHQELNQLTQPENTYSKHSKILGVRYNCLKLLIKRVELGGFVTDADISGICTTFKNESLL